MVNVQGVNKTVVAVCLTILIAFVFGGYVYLEVRGRSSMAITTLILQVLAALPGVLAYASAKRAQVAVDTVAEHTNGHLRTQTELASRALGALEPRKADEIVREVASTSPADDPPA